MNFVIIPFFLAASVNQTTEWPHGPEFVFRTNLTYLLSTDLMEEPFYRTNLTTIMKCRPRTDEALICRFEEAVMEAQAEDPPEKTEIEHPFMIQFNPRGIDKLYFPEVIDSEKLNIIRSLVKELSVGVNYKQNMNALPMFVATENYVLGECATRFAVLEYDKDEGLFVQDEQRNYNLETLSLTKRKADSVTVIQKRTEYKRCNRLEDPSYHMHGVDIKIGKSINKMYIGASTFKSQTDMHIKMSKATGKKDFILQDIASVELKDIQPAKRELTNMEFPEVVTLRFGEEMEHNFLI